MECFWKYRILSYKPPRNDVTPYFSYITLFTEKLTLHLHRETNITLEGKSQNSGLSINVETSVKNTEVYKDKQYMVKD